jgi:hypothetical protein
MSAILARLKEPSTWAGIAGVVAGLSFLPHAVEIGAIVTGAGIIVMNVLAIVIPEKKS